MTFDILKSDDVTVSAAVHHLATKAQIKLLEDQEEEFVALRMPFYMPERISGILCYTPWRPSVRLSVRPSVCPSVR
jgi:hypothetical protein